MLHTKYQSLSNTNFIEQNIGRRFSEKSAASTALASRISIKTSCSRYHVAAQQSCERDICGALIKEQGMQQVHYDQMSTRNRLSGKEPEGNHLDVNMRRPFNTFSRSMLKASAVIAALCVLGLSFSNAQALATTLSQSSSQHPVSGASTLHHKLSSFQNLSTC
jgi:hypothetical protein